MEFDLESLQERLPVKALFYAVVLFSLWIIPMLMDMPSIPFLTKLVASIVMIPVIHIIIEKIADN